MTEAPALVAQWCLFVCAFRYRGLAATFWRFTQSPGASVLLVIGALGTLCGLFDMLVTVPVVALAWRLPSFPDALANPDRTVAAEAGRTAGARRSRC